MIVPVLKTARAPAIALVLAVIGMAAAVERFASPSGAIPVVREAGRHASPEIRIGGPAYPRTVRDVDGFTVRVARPAHSVVSQYWSIDEFVYAIIPPAYVTGVSSSAYQAASSNVFAQVQRFHPVVATDPEMVLRAGPELILVSSSTRADFTALVRSAGIPVHRTFTMFTSLRQVAETIRLVGYLAGQDEAAQREYTRFTDSVERAKRRRPSDMLPPRVLGFGGSFSYGSETLFNDIVQTLGALNVGAEGGLEGYNEINTEQILRWNPEWIFGESEPGKTKEQVAKLMADPAISLTEAAKRGQIVVFEHHVFLPMSPYTTMLLEALGDALYGR